MSVNNVMSNNIFKQIFIDYWEIFKKKCNRYNSVYYENVITKMLNCGELFFGYSLYVCGYCGMTEKKVAFSCKSSFCLSCGKVYTDNWSSHLSEILHPGLSYRHVVLTMPEDLHLYFYRSPGLLLSELMELSVICLDDLLKTVRKQKLKGGYIVLLQTYGRSGEYNPHLHIIMTDGGVNKKTGRWVDLGYFPYKVLHKKWQYYLLKMLKEKINTLEVKKIVSLMWKKYKKSGFVAHIDKGSVPRDCKNLAKYLGKYVVSPPISLRRILNYDGKTVTYWYMSHETEKKEVVTVDVLTFIGRMVQHILPKGFKRIRYYGLQATRTFEKLKGVVFRALKCIGRAVKGFFRKVNRKSYRELYREFSGNDPFLCSKCGGEMILWEIWHPKYGIIYDELEYLEKRSKYKDLYDELFKIKRDEHEFQLGTSDSGRIRNNGESSVLQLSLPFL